MKYQRITVRIAGAKRAKTYWATNYREREDGRIQFTVCDKEGTVNEDGTINIVLCTKEDITKCLPARMNLKYAELEVIGE